MVEEDLEDLKKMIKREFKNDPALQQVHIARKIIAKEAANEELSYFAYIKKQVKEIKNIS